MCAALAAIGLHLLMFPQVIEMETFGLLQRLVPLPAALGTVYLLFGWFRVAALVANGRIPVWGPRARMVGAAIGAAVWAQMGLGLVDLRTPPPSMMVYFLLCIGELAATYMAAADDRSRIQ